MTKQAARAITHRIPGGWYGNDPGFVLDDPDRGNVVVDPGRIAPAVRWLAKRAEILGTAIAEHCGGPGVAIDYRYRGR